MRNEHNQHDDETEYHFSEEDVFDAEHETVKSMPAVTRTSLLEKINQHRRWIISSAVFLVLLFIVYKIIAPVSVAPTTDIVAQTTTPGMADALPTPTASAVKAHAPSLSATLANPHVAATNTSNSPASQIRPPPLTPQPTLTAPVQAIPAMPSSNAAPNTFQPALTAAPFTQQSSLGNPNVASASPLPAAMPVPTSVNSTPAMTEQDKIIREMQAAYLDRLNEFATQNRLLQDQLQTMNARVSAMEAQLNQMTQVLLRTNQPPPTPPSAPNVPSQTTSEKSLYNVQAIIPGRAWLRSESGETVTVAEGDTIKDLGRVTKIDPYDGVVEVNTGNKIVSLSYGSMG